MEKATIEEYFQRSVVSQDEMTIKAARYKEIDEILAEKLLKWEEFADRS